VRFFEGLSDRERAVFEAGITLGAIYHQFTGTPVNRDNVRVVERCIEEAASLQPCVEDVEVSIEIPDGSEDNYGGYTEVNGRNLKVTVITRCGEWRVKARLEFIEELDYPLMWIEEIERVER